MSVRAIDSDGDWTFGSGVNNYKTNIEEIDQNIVTRLREWVGDCYFDVNAGIDYLNLLGTNSVNELEFQIRLVILRTRGVIGIEALSIELNNDRELNINYSVRTINTLLTREMNIQ